MLLEPYRYGECFRSSIALSCVLIFMKIVNHLRIHSHWNFVRDASWTDSTLDHPKHFLPSLALFFFFHFRSQQGTLDHPKYFLSSLNPFFIFKVIHSQFRTFSSLLDHLYKIHHPAICYPTQSAHNTLPKSFVSPHFSALIARPLPILETHSLE